MSDGVVISAGDHRDVAALRHHVLRSHMPGIPFVAPQDELPGTVHLVARRGGVVVGVVTYFAEEAPHRPGEPALRFRGMAVDPAEQGRGTGTALIRRVLDDARARNARVVWANGRDSAEGFYRGLGFEVVGDMFIDETSRLPHHVICFDLDRPAG